MIGGGTDNHLILAVMFMARLGVTGKEAQTVLDEVGITLNMNLIAGDPRKANGSIRYSLRHTGDNYSRFQRERLCLCRGTYH